MKSLLKIPKTIGLLITSLLTILLLLLSCNSEDVFVVDDIEVMVEDSKTPEDADNETSENTLKPCDFGLYNIEANSSVLIDCILDLEGQTIELPANVTIEYDGGDIINGTIYFSDNTVISGELLNATLIIKGVTPQLKNPIFNFDPTRWGIVQGDVIKDIAFNNHLIIQDIINLIVQMGSNTFQIDEMNAYFSTIRKPNKANLTEIISLPSNFHLKMSDNTFIRVFPQNDPQTPPAIKIYKQKNVQVSGGYLIGDRLEHGPIPGGLTVLTIKGSENILIENVHVNLSGTAGIGVNSFLFEGDTNYVPSKNVTISNCTFDRNSLAGVAITDGQNIIIENSTFTKTGLDVANNFGLNEGLAPRTGIIVETAPGQVINDVFIINNVVEESDKRSILAVGSTNVTITGNTTDSNIGWTTARNVVVSNNTLNGGGINAGYAGDKPTHGVIYGNKIKNTSTGIQITNKDIDVYDNEITNCTVGMMLREVVNSEIYNNIIIGDLENSFGINAQKFADNVVIRNNSVSLDGGRPFYWTSVNRDEEYSDYRVDIKDNIFECTKSGSIVKGSGYNITGNNFTGVGFGLGDMNNVLVSDNIVKSNSGGCFGINKTNSSTNILVKNNVFESTSSSRLSAYGIKINIVGDSAVIEDSKIVFDNNEIIVTGVNYGVHSTNFDGITFINNTVTNTDKESIYFRGDDSVIKDNDIITVDIQGNGNKISNNN